jgi:tRNA 2-thiocytidine biosynthesis protein TtcA
MLRALGHVVPSHLMDRNLHPFESLQASGLPNPDGDRAFDPDESGCGPLPATASSPPADSQAVRWWTSPTETMTP